MQLNLSLIDQPYGNLYISNLMFEQPLFCIVFVFFLSVNPPFCIFVLFYEECARQTKDRQNYSNCFLNLFIWFMNWCGSYKCEYVFFLLSKLYSLFFTFVTIFWRQMYNVLLSTKDKIAVTFQQFPFEYNHHHCQPFAFQLAIFTYYIVYIICYFTLIVVAKLLVWKTVDFFYCHSTARTRTKQTESVAFSTEARTCLLWNSTHKLQLNSFRSLTANGT